MGRETSIFIWGEYWLDKRRDGKSPDIWQVARYSETSRSVIYRSTKCRTVNVEGAKAFLRAHEARERSKVHGQPAEQAELLPHLFNYLREHGPDVKRLDTVKSSFRAWIGFLMQDELGTGARVADISKTSVARFRRWRMGPHEWKVEWNGKIYHRNGPGVCGQSVQRNIEDLRAALNHAEDERRTIAPKVPSVDKKLRKKRSRQLLTFKQLGMLFGYAQEDEGVWRELALMMATACRPGAALAFDPETQWHGGTLDLQPAERDETDKRNAIVPVIEPLEPILKAWKEKPHPRVASRKRWWKTARKALNMPGIEAYDIRHTVTTFLDSEGVPGAQYSGIAGHLPESRGVSRTTSEHYLHYDPDNAPHARRALTKFFRAVQREAKKWAADHLRTTGPKGNIIIVVKKDAKC